MTSCFCCDWCEEWWQLFWPDRILPKSRLIRAFIFYLFSVGLCIPGAFVLYVIEWITGFHKTFVQSVYVTGSALTTLGFGDIHADSEVGRIYIMVFSMLFSPLHNFTAFHLIRILFFVERLSTTVPPENLVVKDPKITLDHLDHIDEALRQLKTEVAQFRTRVETLAWNTESFLKKINDIKTKAGNGSHADVA